MRTLITGGTVISMDPAIGDLDRGDVLLGNDGIVDVAENIDASDAVVIDASDRVVMPGFVDTCTPGRPRSGASGWTGPSPSTSWRYMGL